MHVPSFGNPDLPAIMTVDTPGFQVTQFAADKALAGNFLAFLHTPGAAGRALREHGTCPIDDALGRLEHRARH